MAADGSLNFDTNLNTNGYEKGLEKVVDSLDDINKSINKLDKGFDGVDKSVADVNNNFTGLKQTLSQFGKVVAAAVSVKAIVSFGKEATETAASVNALNSQFEQTFGTLQDAASNAIQTVADDSGILATRLKGVGTQIYAFAKTSGMDSVTSLNMMQEALQVAADSAAYYDRSLEDVSETLKSFLKGNYANDAALGVSATETTRNAKAMELYGEKFQDLSEAQKQLTLLQMVKDANALSGAEGQAAREAEGWENVTGNLKEAWSQLLAVVGQPILKAATAAVQHLTSALQYLTSQANGAISALYELFGWEQENTAQTANNIQDSVSAQNDLTKAVNKTAKAQKNQLASFDKITKLTENESSSDDKSSDASALSTVPLNGTAKLTVEAETSDATKKIKKFLSEIKRNFNKFSGWVKNNFGGIFNGLWNGLKDEGSELLDTFGRIGTDLQSLLTPLQSWLSGDFTTQLQTASQTISNILIGLFDTFNRVFADIWDLAVFPMLTSLVTDGLPMWSQFCTESWLTLDTWFGEVKSIFDMLWEDVADPILSLISTVFTDVMSSMKSAWDKWGAPVFDNLRTAIEGTGELFQNVWNKILKPVWDKMMSVADTVWKDHLKPLVDNFLDFVGTFVDGALKIYNKFILPIKNWFVDTLGPIVKTVLETMVENIGSMVSGAADFFSDLIDVFKDIINFLVDVFTGDWESALTDIKDIFSDICDLLYDIIKAPVNLIIGAINKLLEGVEFLVNSMIDGLNTISIDVPGPLQDLVGFDRFGFNLSHIDIGEITPLAKGTVVPANYGEFLAVLGDNKREAEVVSPYSTIVKAVKDALGGSGGAKQPVTINLLLQSRSGIRTVSSAVIDDMNDIIDSTGKIPLHM